MININNFEKSIESKIISRGLSYYENDYISDLEQVEPNEFTAVVEGSEDYNVTIKFNNKNEIISHYCDCPYDWGVFCKHEVAVLYYLKDIVANKTIMPKGKVARIKEEISKMKKSELQDLIIEFVKGNATVRNELAQYLELEEEEDDY